MLSTILSDTITGPPIGDKQQISALRTIYNLQLEEKELFMTSLINKRLSPAEQAEARLQIVSINANLQTIDGKIQYLATGKLPKLEHSLPYSGEKTILELTASYTYVDLFRENTTLKSRLLAAKSEIIYLYQTNSLILNKRKNATNKDRAVRKRSKRKTKSGD